jgi:hypothetical protein
MSPSNAPAITRTCFGRPTLEIIRHHDFNFYQDKQPTKPESMSMKQFAWPLSSLRHETNSWPITNQWQLNQIIWVMLFEETNRAVRYTVPVHEYTSIESNIICILVMILPVMLIYQHFLIYSTRIFGILKFVICWYFIVMFICY